MRDDLTETDKIDAGWCVYHSPDIIPYTQVSDPGTFFSGNYGSDVGQSIEYGEYNYFYVRCKNYSGSASIASIQLFWSKTSLIMFPSTWKEQSLNINQKIKTNIASIPSMADKAIGVSPLPFVWTPPEDLHYGYCMIATVGTGGTPKTIPSASTWNSFVSWVRTNKDVAWHNLTVVDNSGNPDYDKLLMVHNDTSSAAPFFVTTTLTNFPVGTTIKQKCSPLSIDSTFVTTSAKDWIESGNPIMPAGFKGSLQVMITLPNGTSWPSDGKVLINAYVGTDSQNDELNLMEFAEPDLHKNVSMELVGLDSDTGRLVEVGNDTILFKTTTD
jgi:hypothetical protein